MTTSEPTTSEKPQKLSIASWLTSDERLDPISRAARLTFLESLTEDEKAAALYNWLFWARPNQLAPADDDWRFWLVMSGRGFGKTRLGAEWVRNECENNPKARIALVGPTLQDVRETMIEGESGLYEVCPPWNKPKYWPSRLLLKWKNGAMAKGFGAEKPERIRGKNLTGAWCDEWAAWAEKKEDGGTGADAWKNLKLATRKGRCRIVITTTPRRKKRLREFLERAEKNKKRYRVQKGSTYENLSNLGENYLEMIEDLQGTTLGAQELDGDFLDDVDGALWTMALITKGRKDPSKDRLPQFVRKVLGIDPATKDKPDSDETGIVLVGIDRNNDIWVIADYSAKMRWEVWPRLVLDLVTQPDSPAFGASLVVETNKVGDAAVSSIRKSLRPRERMPRYREVHSSDGKDTRAEPFVSLYESGRVHHWGSLPGLEAYMTSWVPGSSSGSPDPLDALVHALADLAPNWGKYGK